MKRSNKKFVYLFQQKINMRITHIAAECFPVLKAGGLGDVVGSLPKYLQKLGTQTEVIVPHHWSKFTENAKMELVFRKNLFFGEQFHDVKIWHDTENFLGFSLFLIEIPGMFPRLKVYGYNDDSQRFIFFQTVALLFLKSREKKPDIIHCHDHHTGLIPFLMKNGLDFREFSQTPSIFTIHNGEYTGQMSWNLARLIPKFDVHQRGMIDWNDTINPITSGIKNSWKVTTVSEGYLQELILDDNSTGKAIQEQWMKSVGIVNGIDTEIWNPKNDKYIENNYDIKTVTEGKRKNKETICFRYGLNPNFPLFAYVGRMATEKGADLLPFAMAGVLSQYKKVNFMIVGSGSPHFENAVEYTKKYFPKNINTFIGYDEALAHLVYAGADYIMMPSRIEPCGLNQLYAMNYGTIPIVRKTGGLKDTVKDIDDNGEGFTFLQANGEDLKNTILRALYFPWDEKKLQKHRQKLMKIDNSWEKSAEKYLEIYKKLIP